MKGDQADFVSRLRLTLPEGWFADVAPLLQGLLAGLAAAWAQLFSLLAEVRLQTRLATVGGQFLDLACVDFFGSRFGRRLAENDDQLRDRLQRALLRERATRGALIAAAGEAGYAATIFEPAVPADTGAYSTAGGVAWGIAGGWGSLSMPLECLVTVRARAPVGAIGPSLAEAVPAGAVAWVRVAG